MPDILDDSYIIAYLPLHNADGEVMAVLGVDAKLGYSDFAQYGPINFERLTSISALLFLLSLVLFVLCMDKGLSEEEKENRWRRRHGLPPKPTKKIGWSDLQSGEIRRSMKKDIRHCKDFMQLEVEDCLAGDWETVYKNWDSCRKHRMI